MKKMTALISVFHKDGIIEFARELIALGFEVISSGGTFKHLKEKGGLQVKDVAGLVGGGAILGHRVVTLSREVHAGLLARYIDEDIAEMEKLGLPYIDLVCNDLYPLKEEIAKPESTRESVIEKTDIGGPTMLSSSAKGRRITVCDPTDRQKVIDWLKAGRPDEDAFITALSAKADYVVADYRLTSAVYHGQGTYAGIIGKKVVACKYGENGYQTPAGLYSTGTNDSLALDKFSLVLGTDPSFNNLADLDRLVQTMTHVVATFEKNDDSGRPFVAIGVKHGNPCGAGFDFKDPSEAIWKMTTGDPLALFGGLVMVNFPVDVGLAKVLMVKGMNPGDRRILDGIIAPSFDADAIEHLKRKGDKCRLFTNPALLNLGMASLDQAQRLRCVRGGFLAQPNYTYILDINDPDLKRYGEMTAAKMEDLFLAKAICDTSNSNTITIVKNGTLIGNGVGQQARVRGAKLAVNLTNYSSHIISGAVAASDSFFPFTDGAKVLAENGVKAILATSGSVHDNDVIEYCKGVGVALWLIPDKKGRGFFGH